MRKAPVFYTLAQVKFNPVLNMGEYISQIQPTLRRKYPDFSEEKQARLQFNLAGELGKQPTLQMLGVNRWQFKNEKRTSGFILMGDSLVFHTTVYENSQWFIDCMMEGLKVVHAVVELSYVEGVGIRTLDAVMPLDGETLHEYLHPGLLGIGSDLQGSTVQSITELILQGPHGQLTSRAARLDGSIGIPLDLAPIPLEMRAEIQTYNGKHVVLDNDCSVQRRAPFDEDDILTMLRGVKEGVTEPFYRSVTPHALKSWE